MASAGPVGEALLDGGLDGRALVVGGQVVERARAGWPGRRWRSTPAASRAAPCSANTSAKNASHGVPEDDRVGHLHHRGLEVQREQHALGLGVGDLLPSRNVDQRALAHDRGVDDLAARARGLPSLSTVTVPSAATCSMRRSSASATVTDCSLERKSSVAHGGDVGLRVRRPGAHRVRVLAGVLLHRGGGPAVGVALAQHRVDGAALDLVVAGLDVALGVGGRARRGSRGGRSPWPAARRWPP